MQILCGVNQVECLRRGIDAPLNTIKIEVNPAKLPEDIREFLAEHIYDGYKLHTIELCRPDLLGLVEAVLIRKEYKEAVDGKKRHVTLHEWKNGKGRNGRAHREELAKELTEAQGEEPSMIQSKTENDNFDRLQEAAKGAIQLFSKK